MQNFINMAIFFLLEVKMINSQILETIKQAQRIVDQSEIKQEFKQVAFQKTFDYLIKRLELSPSVNLAKPETIKQEPMAQHAKTFAGFLRQTNAKIHQHKVLSAAYFFMKKNKIIFTRKDIESAYRACLLPKPVNTSQDIGRLIKKGLLMLAEKKIENKKGFQITLDGISFVEKKLIKNDNN